MGQSSENRKGAREALKKLRESRKPSIQAATTRMKAREKAIEAIKTQLRNGARTVPEIAAATGAATAETLWTIAALKKYGQVVEAEKEGSYFKYALSGKYVTEKSDETESEQPV